MDAVCMGCYGHINTVVDQEGDARSSAQAPHLLGHTDHFPRAPFLLAKLDCIGAARNGKPGKLQVRVPGLKDGVGQYVKFSNLLHG
jgi:hypothetical protein